MPKAEKTVFPVASTLIGGGAAGTIGFLGSFLGLPERKITDLTPKKWGVTVDKEKKTLNYNGCEYQLEIKGQKVEIKQTSQKFNSGKPYITHFSENKPVHEIGRVFEMQEIVSGDAKETFDALRPLGFYDKVYVAIKKKRVSFINDNKHSLAFHFEPAIKDKGKHNVKSNPEYFPITPALKQSYREGTEAFKQAVLELKYLANTEAITLIHEQMAKLPNPEPIENLLHGAGKKVGLITAITAGTLALGAGIGYLIGNKINQHPPTNTSSHIK